MIRGNPRGLPLIITLVCYEKFERIETSQFQNCFTKHDFLYRESIENRTLTFSCFIRNFS